MANTKISELPQLVGAPSDSDFIPIVDNSELVTKRILVSDLLINVPESGIDSATAQSIASAEIASTVDSAYVQSRQIVYGDGDVTALVDSNYVQSRQIVYGDADVTSLVDSNYVQSRQIVYGDADVTSLVDSNYVQTRIPLSGGYAINYDSSTGSISFDQSTDLTVNSLATVSSLVVGGDLQVNGTTTTVNAVNLEVTDNMIYMNAGESAGSPVAFIDVGFAANVNETGSYAHTGFFRDASDNGTWKLFDGYQPEPDSAVQINTGHPSFSLASLQVDAMTATSYAGDGSQLTGMFDSAAVVGIVDSAYVQLRQDRIQNLYDSGTGIRITGSLVIDSDISVAGYQFTGLVGTPSNGAFITWDSDLDVMTFTSVDSNNAAITTLIDSDYIQSRVTLNGSGIDSATAVSIANAEILSVVDSAYVQLRQDRLHNLRDSGTGVVITGNLHVESDLTVAGVATISGFDIGIQGDSVTGIGNIGIGEDVLINLTSGSENLVLGYLSGSAISTGSNNILLGFNVQTTDSAASHEIVLGNDSNNRLRIPGLGLDTNDATNGQVLSWDSATSQFSWLTIPASGIDSAGVVSLVDSAYVQSRVTLDGVGLDSAGVITVLNDTTVGQFTDTLSTTIATIMGVGAVGLDIDDTVPNFTVAIGAYALDVASTGTANTAIGRLAGGSITTGSQNVAVGHESLDNTLNSITDNVSIGVTSAQGLAGSRNILVGTEAGYQAGITNNSVLIGYQAGKNVAGTGSGQSNNIVIGYQAAISAQNVSNEITLGNASIDRLRIPGLGLDTNDATDGQSLTWDSATGNFAWSTITAGASGIDSASVVQLLSTGVNDIVPAADSAYDLGSPTNRWRDLYLSGNSIYLGDSAVISATGATLNVNGQPIAGGVTIYDSASVFPVNPSEADLAYANNTNALYIFDGTNWQRVSSGINEVPEFTVSPDSAYDLNPSGTPTVISVTAVDPEGFDITYDYDTAPSNQTQATISVTGNTYTITPSTDAGDAGSFTLRFKASDGIHTSYRTSVMSLAFSAITFVTDSYLTSTGANLFDYASETPNISSGGSRTNQLNLGKRYFEIELTDVTSKFFMVGLINDALTSYGYSTTGVQVVYGNTGNMYPSNTSYLSKAPDTVGDIIMVAYDTDTRELWYGINGTWGEDPTTASSYTIGGSAGDAVSYGIANGGSSNFSGTFLQGASLNYSVPTGFTSH